VIDRHRAESHQIRKDRHRTELPVDPVRVPHLAVAVPVRGVRKLERDERVISRPVQGRASIE
jgi:hypothetical protein